MYIYRIVFEHPDHGKYDRLVRSSSEVTMDDARTIQHKLDIYNTIVEIESIIEDERIIRI
jgi:hypothetical protein